MPISEHRLVTCCTAAATTLILALAAVPGVHAAPPADVSAAPAAQSAPVEVRSADSRDAALAATTSSGVEVRSADSRDAALAAQGPVRLQNAGRAVAAVQPSSATVGDPGGTDWNEVGLLVGAVLALTLIAALAAVSTGRGRPVGGSRRPAH